MTRTALSTLLVGLGLVLTGGWYLWRGSGVETRVGAGLALLGVVLSVVFARRFRGY
ncbi:MAG: hypothetical protein ABEH61_05375 [Haloarculaceae archaeon]